MISLLRWTHRMFSEHDLRGTVGDALVLGRMPDDVARDAVVHRARHSAAAPPGESDAAPVVVLCSPGQEKAAGGAPPRNAPGSPGRCTTSSATPWP